MRIIIFYAKYTVWKESKICSAKLIDNVKVLLHLVISPNQLISLLILFILENHTHTHICDFIDFIDF